MILHEQPWYTPLRDIADELNKNHVPYCIVGGVALALHGIPIETTDIDVETNRDGAYIMQNLFEGKVTMPVAWREGICYRSHFGHLEFNGVEVDIMGQIERREGDQWVCTAVTTAEKVNLNGVSVYVPWLEEEVLANIRRGRMDRAGESLKHCDPQRMLALLRGIVHTNVI